MITKIEALNYRTLRYVSQTLSPFQVLIGPNASGKSTFLDVVAFMADIINQPSLTDAVRMRAPDMRDLTWMRESEWFELAIETKIPEKYPSDYSHLRYEIRVGVSEETFEVASLVENLWFVTSEMNGEGEQKDLFPYVFTVPTRITHDRSPSEWRKIVSKTNTVNDYLVAETTKWKNTFRSGAKRPALANLPADEGRFLISNWFRRFIAEGVQRIQLNSEALRRPSPPQSPRAFLPDGSNLPWVVYDLANNHPDLHREWIEHLRTALPSIKDVMTIRRDEDNHRYLVVEYDSGLRAPSWLVSDGTLRMLALTILAYLPDLQGVYLIEEPENGIHPKAVETVYQSLSNIYDAQVFLATHSPVILSLTEPHQLLCFDRTPIGETDIVRGDLHPKLTEWRGEISLSTLFAAGVLG